MREVIEMIIGMVIVAIWMICLVLLSVPKKVIGTNMNNETKEYIVVINNSCGITEDGKRELLKSYKFKK